MTLLSHPKKGSPYVLACSVTVYSKWCHLEPGLTSLQFLGTNYPYWEGESGKQQRESVVVSSACRWCCCTGSIWPRRAGALTLAPFSLTGTERYKTSQRLRLRLDRFVSSERPRTPMEWWTRTPDSLYDSDMSHSFSYSTQRVPRHSLHSLTWSFVQELSGL